MNTTNYRPITGFPGYRVGDDGTVWRLWVTCRSGRKLGDQWRQMKLAPGSRGYLRVNLTPERGGKFTTFRVHRLVLEAFVGPCPDGHECRHLNGIKGDNRLSNLAWGTPQENREDNVSLGAYQRGEAHSQAKLTDAQAREIRTRRANGESLAALSAAYNVSQSAISMIARGKSRKQVVTQSS